MSREIVDRLLRSLAQGDLPLVRLRPRRGSDVRIVRVTGSSNRRFLGLLVDSSKEDDFISLPYEFIEHGTILVEEVSETP